MPTDQSGGPVVFLQDLLIINIPVFLFMAGSALAAFLGTRTDRIPRIFFFLLAWWCLCGAVMLTIDYRKRKRFQFQRLCAVAGDRLPPPALKASLSSTLCGRCLLLAVTRRHRLTYKIIQEDSP